MDCDCHTSLLLVQKCLEHSQSAVDLLSAAAARTLVEILSARRAQALTVRTAEIRHLNFEQQGRNDNIVDIYGVALQQIDIVALLVLFVVGQNGLARHIERNIDGSKTARARSLVQCMD